MKDKELKPNANVVGVGDPDDPLFEEITKNTPKTNSNTKHQTLTSNVAITLIALVITIIVMLILVGVTVSIAINGGLFGTAKKAVTKTEEAKDSELRFMAMANAATHNEKWVYEVDGEKIPIPAGFAPTEIEGETSTEDGFVIIDAEGNEFVWIPCTEQEYENATFDKDTWPCDDLYKNSSDWIDSQTSTGATSIKNNGGFYVARYEAGIPENAPFYASKEGDSYQLWNTNNKGKNTNKFIPVSKKGYPAWNFISQTNAKTVSEKMYSGTSYLIDSHAWNYICKNILGPEGKAKKDITNSTTWGNYYNNTTTKYENLDVLYALHEWDNNNNRWTKCADGTATGEGSIYHKGLIPNEARTGNKYLELSTGASSDFMGYNIYDMAGNMREWATETVTNLETTYAAVRDGSFASDGSISPVVQAGGLKAGGHCSVGVGFRVVLYL